MLNRTNCADKKKRLKENFVPKAAHWEPLDLEAAQGWCPETATEQVMYVL